MTYNAVSKRGVQQHVQLTSISGLAEHQLHIPGSGSNAGKIFANGQHSGETVAYLYDRSTA